ncbi:hypothetical protein M422DRAFT_192932, partial [Sphaerobolus stellatus SS14]
AIFTGGIAFYLSETNSRTAPPTKETLRELLIWKWNKMRKGSDAVDDEVNSRLL